VQDFVSSFHSINHIPIGTLTPSEVAVVEMKKILESANIWKTYYQQQLGINFITEKEWFLKSLDKIYLGKKVIKGVVDRLVNVFLFYIFFVNMILTIIRKLTKMEVNRSQCFQAAVACFKEFAQVQLQNTSFLHPKTKQKLAFLFKFLSYWMSSDATYRSSLLFERSELSNSAKACFNFIFSNSILR
jgi:hypothetical protein